MSRAPDPDAPDPDAPDADAPDAGDFYARVYAVVRAVPPGRVTTYGRVARALGAPRASRGVGWALRAVAGVPTDVPCHRVVNRAGELTGRRHFETPTLMEERLRAEGVPFRSDGAVDLSACVWDPSPSPAGRSGAAAVRRG